MALPSFDRSDHAAFLVPSKHGSIDVRRIDDLPLAQGGCVLLKVDVEGQELAVIRGATELLSKAEHFVVLFEAHYRQAQRTQIDPVRLITYVKNLRPCIVTVTERPDAAIDFDRPFFAQFPNAIYNVCLSSE